MANNGILWQLVSGIDPLGQLSRGIQQGQQRQTVLEQLAGQREDRQFARETNARDFQFRTEESQRNQGNADRAFSASRTDAASANARADRAYQLQLLGLRQDDVKEVKNADGSTTLVRIPRDPNAAPVPINIPGNNQAPRNPYAPNGKTTDEQAKAAGYSNRMAASNDIIGRFEGINDSPTGWAGGVIANTLPQSMSNNMLSAPRQQFMQAQRDFINAVLRRESGAVISDSEFANARQQYFPQPGDSTEVLKQKAANRLTAIQGIMGAAGPSYQPPQNYHPQQQTQQPQQPQIQNGMFARNPQTGQRIQFQNGQWVPAQ
jgi:hypothetical protein